MTDVRLNDDQWEKIRDYLKTDPNAYVGKEADCRLLLDSVKWISRSGSQWRLLPETYGNWNTVYKRFVRWCKAGVWERMLSNFAQESDRESLMIDSTIVRAHPCAAGAEKKR